MNEPERPIDSTFFISLNVFLLPSDHQSHPVAYFARAREKEKKLTEAILERTDSPLLLPSPSDHNVTGLLFSPKPLLM